MRSARRRSRAGEPGSRGGGQSHHANMQMCGVQQSPAPPRAPGRQCAWVEGQIGTSCSCCTDCSTAAQSRGGRATSWVHHAGSAALQSEQAATRTGGRCCCCCCSAGGCAVCWSSPRRRLAASVASAAASAATEGLELKRRWSSASAARRLALLGGRGAPAGSDALGVPPLLLGEPAAVEGAPHACGAAATASAAGPMPAAAV